MSNEILDTRLQELRSKADRSRTAFVAYATGLAINSVVYGIDLASYANNESGSLWNYAPLVGIVLTGGGAASSGIRAIQTGQEVASLAAVQAQMQLQSQETNQ